MSILGNRVLRTEDPAFLTKGGTYVDDVVLPGTPAHVVYVRSTMASARLLEVDTSEAAAMPGVLAVVTIGDIDIADQAPSMGFLNQQMLRPLLARDVVRFVGEPIAAVVAETRSQATDAAELVIVDYDPLDAVVDPEAALSPVHPLFPDADTQGVMSIPAGGMTADFSDCEVVVEQRIVNQKVAPCPIEPRSAAAYWDEDGRLVVYSSNQGAHPIRESVAQVLGLTEDQVRVVTPDVGGSFGSKSSAYPEDLLLGPLAKKVGRPVKWTETRSESMVNLGHGRAQIQDVTIGGTRDGKITAYRLKVVQDSGAYPMMGAVLPFMTRMMTTGVYDVTNAEFSAESVVTNTTPLVAFRGAGRPEATAAIERSVDLFAAEIGMDPAEVRRRNLLADDVFPYDTPGGATYDIGAYGAALDLLLESAGYDELRAEQQRRRDAGATKVLGLGLSVYVEITALGGGSEFGSVELRSDGTFLAKTGSSPYGQGHKTAWAMLVADRLGVPIDQVEVVFGDTDVIPTGSVTGGSRSVQVAGSAIHDAAGKLHDLARDAAADLLEANADDLVLGEPGDDGRRRFHVAGVPAVSVGWDEVATTASANPLVGVSDFNAPGPTFPFGAHLAVVEVDIETGAVELTRLVAVDDAGTILNPLLADGQVHGGLAQGAAQALLEEVRYDEDGNPLTTNFMDYAVITATELPMFERIPMETPTPYNELGAKGIGESGTVGATPAVQNAVVDALAHLGVRHVDMPCTPERVWRTLEEAATTTA